jgi:drug/metabolite transporter (DMT)-like permease
MTNMFWINGIGLWICAAVLMAITIIEQRAILRGRRAPGSWLAEYRAQVRSMQNFTWVFLGIAVVSVVGRTVYAGGLVFPRGDFWLIVGVFFSLHVAFRHMYSAAQWAEDAMRRPA